jgi:hypothetical protein
MKNTTCLFAGGRVANAEGTRLGCVSTGLYVFTVAQIFNLLYRRFVIGKASDRSHAPWFPDDWQSATLRYSRLQVGSSPRLPSLSRSARRGENVQTPPRGHGCPRSLNTPSAQRRATLQDNARPSRLPFRRTTSCPAFRRRPFHSSRRSRARTGHYWFAGI